MPFRKFYTLVILLAGMSPVSIIAGKAFGVVMLTNCGVISEEYETRVDKMVEQWGAKNPELAQPLKAYLSANRPYAELLDQYNAMDDAQKDQFKASCDEGLRQAFIELGHRPSGKPGQ
jgi:hypothetical protein